MAAGAPLEQEPQDSRPRRVLQRGARQVADVRVPPASLRSIARVAKTDGRTYVQVYRAAGGGWFRPRRRIPFTAEEIVRMRGAGVAEVVLRRRFRTVSMPLSWVP